MKAEHIYYTSHANSKTLQCMFIEIGPDSVIVGSGRQPEREAERGSRSSNRICRRTGEVFHTLDMFPRLREAAERWAFWLPAVVLF